MIKKKIKVSIIISTLNSEKTLRECIESCLDQDYPNKEIIIIDGKSTDQTINIINTFNSKVIIPIIGMDNIRSKILFHRNYMIYLKYKKRLWRKIRRHFITKYFSNVLPIELSRYIANLDMYI